MHTHILNMFYRSLVICFAIASLGTAQALTITALPDYDGTFPGLCNNGVSNYDCEQAVAEARNGDNGTSARTFEWGIGPNTAAPADTVDIASSSGLWNDSPLPFSLSYDASSDLLRFAFTSLGLTNPNADYTVDLNPTKTMYIRAVSRSGQPTTQLTGLSLNGLSINNLVGNDTADYWLLSGFNWNANWALTGNLTMMGAAIGSQARPAVQFKLTNLEPPPSVPEPTTLALLGLGLAGLGYRRWRKA